MTSREFNNLVVEALNNELGTGYQINVNTIPKNNGIKLSGLTIREDDINIAPTIYLEQFYDKYQDNHSIDMIIEEILNIYNENKMCSSMDVSFFTDFSNIKERIVFRLINFDANKELLEGVPHKKYLDLAIVFCYYLEEIADDKRGSILIKNEHMELWNSSVEELFDLADNNTPRIVGFEMKNIAEVIKASDADVSLVIDDETMPPLYVATNNSMLYGASCILYENMLKAFSLKLNSNLFIIPSSVHEVLLLPDCGDDMDKQVTSLKETISFVNKNELIETDILSGNLYYYDLKSDAISIM